MAQRRGGERGVAKLLTCMVLMLFGALGFTAGCSAEMEPEALESSSQEQTLCTCPKSTPCVTYTCLKTECVATPARDGTSCEDPGGAYKGLCLDGLCCPGCVVRPKLGNPFCAARGGTDPTQCGRSGEYCDNCNSNSCLTGACSSRSCVPVPEGDACTNSPGACHNGSCCQGCIDGNGACVAGGAVDACGISDGKLVKCQSCNDGDDCNGKETCSAGSCQPGTEPDCNDNEVCTDDYCDGNGCQHKPRTGADCSDGNACTSGDQCNADGKCEAGTPITCNDGQDCTADTCEEGVCVYAPKPATSCDDNNKCTVSDTCTSEGKCAGTNPSSTFTCDDDNVCTIDAQPDCSVEACTHSPAPATTPCAAPDKCHQDGHCSGTTGACVAGAEVVCDDNNPCTTDSCDSALGCVYTNDPSADCSDGDPCTENDVCVKGTCGGKPKKCAALDACHEAGSCDQTTGTCNDPRAEDGKECPGGTCSNGTCILDPNANPGAGGEAAGGAGFGGEGPSVGGAGPTNPSGDAGEGNEPSGQAGTAPAEEPERPFVRNPGGCSCELPGSDGEQRPLSLIGLAILAGAALRRGRRGRAAA
jgi:hypothetical protein